MLYRIADQDNGPETLNLRT